jgi:hypothetical protein
MLRITIELVPEGDEDEKKRLGVLEISNDRTGNAFTGHYDIVYRTLGQGARGDEISTARGAIKDVERDIVHPEQLAGIAFGMIAPVVRTMSSWPQPWGEIQWDPPSIP